MNLEFLKNKTILLLGKSRAFNEEELLSFLHQHKISLTRELDVNFTLVIEGRMMTPYEQNDCDKLYELHKYEFISIDVLESHLGKDIDGDMLLMSLKLSHDKERLKSFLQNSCISDTLFLKLMPMYSWSGEDFFENDDNRDVSAAFIARFYENIQRNHNVQFATSGFIHLVSQAKNSQILEAILALKPLAFHPKIKMAIAMSAYCNEKLQKKLYKLEDREINEALSLNTQVSEEIFEVFLGDATLGANIAKSVCLNESNFEQLIEFREDLAKNETLTPKMQEKLYTFNEQSILLSLAQNPCLSENIVTLLLQKGSEKIKELLYSNIATPVAILEEVYQKELYHAALAQNENTPIEILYQLNLDSRYERYVKINSAFGKYIQSENLGWL